MKKLLFLIACTYGMSTHAMESSSSAYLNFKALIDHSPVFAYPGLPARQTTHGTAIFFKEITKN